MASSGFRMSIVSLVAPDLSSPSVCTEQFVLEFLYLQFYAGVQSIISYNLTFLLKLKIYTIYS
jgi:hypothetical protein